MRTLFRTKLDTYLFDQKNRPLQNLTKAQLYAYGNGSDKDEWLKTYEIMTRREAWTIELERLEQAERDALALTYTLHPLKAKLEAAKTKGTPADIEKAEADYKRAAGEIDQERKRLEQTKEALRHTETTNNLISQTELNEYYAKRYAKEWNEILEAWAAGQYMKAQNYGWVDFLTATRKDQADDTHAYMRAEQIALLVGQETGKTYLNMRALWQIRVMPSIDKRREFYDGGEPSGVPPIASLEKDQQKAYWRWWRRYNTSTLHYDWPDPSGVARDERQFNVHQLSDEENRYD